MNKKIKLIINYNYVALTQTVLLKWYNTSKRNKMKRII